MTAARDISRLDDEDEAPECPRDPTAAKRKRKQWAKRKLSREGWRFPKDVFIAPDDLATLVAFDVIPSEVAEHEPALARAVSLLLRELADVLRDEHGSP